MEHNPNKIAIPRRNIGPVPAKLFGQNPGPETTAFSLPESIRRTPVLPLRPESKGIASRPRGRWPLLPLSLESRILLPMQLRHSQIGLLKGYRILPLVGVSLRPAR